MSWRKVCAATALLVLVLMPMSAYAISDREMEQRFICQCGCGLTVADCNHGKCGPREQMRAEIHRLLAAGKSPAEIEAVFVAQYGEAVLAAPRRTGLNLLAWWGPYAALVIGTGAIVFLGRAWTRRLRPQPQAIESTLTPEQRTILERELKKLDD